MAAAPPSTKEQVGAALQTAGQYAGGSTVWTPQNAEELGLDPSRGYVAKGTPTDAPQPPTPVEPRPPSMAPGLGTVSGAPVQAPSQAKQAPPTKPVWTPADAGDKPAQDQSNAPARAWTPADAGDKPAPTKLWTPANEGDKPANVQPTTPQKPEESQPQPQPQAPANDRDAKIQAQVQAGKTPGEAQAIVDGQQPTTITGETPPPKPAPAPKTEQPQPIDTLKADAQNRVDPVSLYSYLLGKFANSGLVGYVPPDGARWGIKTGSAAEWAAFGLAVAKQESDLNARSYNAADPGGSAGLFQFGQGQKPYVQGDQFNPQQSADAFVRAVEHYLANKGSVANMGEIFGSIRRPNEAGQYIAGAQKVAAGGTGKDLVSSGRDGGGPPPPGGQPPPPGGQPAGQPMVSVPSAGGTPQLSGQGPRGGGWSGDSGYGGGRETTPRTADAGSIDLTSLLGAAAGGAAASSLFRGGGAGGPQAAQPSEEKGPSPSDVVTKILAAGGPPPAPGAAPVDLSTMKPANVLGVRTVGAPQLGLPAPPPAPSAAPAAPDPIVIKGLMKRGFTREQALAFAAKASVSKPGAAALAGGGSFRQPLQLPAPPPAPSRQPTAAAKPQPVPPQPPAPSGKAPPAKPAPSQEQPPARFEAASHNMRPLGYRAAVRLPNGEVFSGQEHADALDKAVENASMRVSDATTHYGFVDKERNFIGMDEADRLLEKHWYKQRNLPQEASSIGPKGSTVGVPNPPGGPSPDDPRVKKQKDNLTKGEHFVTGDDFHDQLLAALPGGHGGRQRQILGQAEEAIAEKRPMHISYISAPKEAEKFPTRESRTIQYEAHSPEARLMGTTEGQLVGHSFIPVAVGVSPSRKAGEPHQSYIQGLSTNVIANNFAHLNTKLAAMGQKTPYARFGPKFANDLEGYLHNLNAGHTGTGRGYALGTAEYPNEPDTSHVPYKLTRHEADFLNTVINNTGAFAKHEDAKALRELARINGTLITPEGETNRLRHQIEQHEPGWRNRVLEPSIRSFKTGLVHEVHPSEEHMPATIRPGQDYRGVTEAMQRTSERGRPDVPVSVSLHHTFADNKAINQIERDFSEERINEAEARARLHALGEDPDQYRFVGGSGGLITPYEENPEAITPEEHTQLKDNLRKQWIGGKLNVEDYRKKTAEVPLPEIPSRPAAQKEMPSEEPVTPPTPAAPTGPSETEPVRPKRPSAPVGKAPISHESVPDVDPSRHDIPAESNYLYHATSQENVHDIIDAGKLHTHRPWEGTEQEAWPDGSTEKRSYWTHDPKIARSFYPEEGKPALVRAKRLAGEFKRESTGDHYLRKPLSAGHLEIYAGQPNEWIPFKGEAQPGAGKPQKVAQPKAAKEPPAAPTTAGVSEEPAATPPPPKAPGKEEAALRSIPSLKTAIDRGVWNFKKTGERADRYGSEGDKTHRFEVSPSDIPSHWKTHTDPVTKSVRHYDPSLAELREPHPGWGPSPQLKDPSRGRLPEAAEPGLIYRGMSHEEYKKALKDGHFQSAGEYNIGEEQKGLTYFSSDPQQAESYSNGFAPWQYKATPSRPAVVVAVKDPGGHIVHPDRPTELGIKSKVPTSAIDHAYIGHAAIVRPGDWEVRERGGKFTEGSSSSPSSTVAWEKREAPASGEAAPNPDPDHAMALKLWNEHGPEGLKKLLQASMTVGELKDKYGLELSGEKMHRVLSGAAAFPKIAAFYSKLSQAPGAVLKMQGGGFVQPPQPSEVPGLMPQGQTQPTQESQPPPMMTLGAGGPQPGMQLQAPAAPSGTPFTPMPQETGQVNIPSGVTRNVRVTHYGYEKPGEPGYDKNSAKGIGDRDNMLTYDPEGITSVALTPSYRLARFGTKGHSTGEVFQVGDRLFRDDDTTSKELKDHRIDIYDPNKDGTGFPDTVPVAEGTGLGRNIPVPPR